MANKLNRYPVLSHLLFADDPIFFLDKKVKECHNLALILHQYCYASGLVINLNKSGMLFSSKCPRNLRSHMAAELRVPEIDEGGEVSRNSFGFANFQERDVCMDSCSSKYKARGIEGKIDVESWERNIN